MAISWYSGDCGRRKAGGFRHTLRMTEKTPVPREKPSGHQVDVGSFLRDVVNLMAYISTGPMVSAIWRKEREDRDNDEQLQRFRDLVAVHLMAQIPQMLISIAATIRIKIDDGSWMVSKEVVGFVTDGDKIGPWSKGQVLDIREACNKIIHATKVHPNPFKTESGVETIGTLITLSGTRNGKPWTAEVNLQEFCIAVANSDFYPHEIGMCRH
jgi:hypothetical protein